MDLKAEDISKVYKTGDISFSALRGVSFEIGSGNIGVILGPSGSGKSTLLNIAGGIDRPSSGAMFAGGEDLTEMTDRQLTEYRRQSVGFIFQFYNLIPNLTVAENVEVSANISKNPAKVDEMLKVVGIGELRDRFPRELSGGQQQRVSIARALVKNPELLLCDEPTGALDYDAAREILKLLEEINRRFKTTVLIVTHNNAIAGMAHRILRLRSGELVEDKVNDNKIPAERVAW
jgi:putative ABC transport system ATP-binding protein